MAIVLWIGIVISAQAFQVTPREHAPAVVIGMLPAIGAWGALMAKNGLHAAAVSNHPESVLEFCGAAASLLPTMVGADANGRCVMCAPTPCFNVRSS